MKLHRVWGAVVLCAALTGSASAEELYDTTNVFRVAYGGDFTVDGDMTKGVWQEAVAIPSLRLHAGKDVKRGDAEVYASEIKLRYSTTALYVGAVFHQPMDQVLAKFDQHDMPIWSDDNLEMFLMLPSEHGPEQCHFAINALGVVYDDKEGRKTWWVPGEKCVTQRFDDRWTMELKLPYKGLGIERPFAGDALGVRFCRTVYAPRKTVSSSPLLTGSSHQARHDFAKVSFEAPTGSAAAQLAAEAEQYRREAVARRLAKLTEETEELLAGLGASVPLFKAKRHPVYTAAVEEIGKMQSAYQALRREKGGDLDALKAQLAAFRRKISDAAYVIWEGEKWEYGSARDLPPVSVSAIPLLKFEAAGNEREAVCLNFAGLLAGPRLDLRIVPEACRANGKYVKPDQFEIYEEPFVFYDAQTITAPLVRKPGNAITLTPGRPVRVWIILNTRGMKPGTYPMTLKLKPMSDTTVAVREMKAEVKVWNFTLPETHEWPMKSFFWGPHIHKTDEAATLRLMHAYHVTHGWTMGHLYTYGVTDSDWYVTPKKKFEHGFDPELVAKEGQKFFDTARELKMKFVFGWSTPVAPEWFQQMSDRLRAMGFDYGDFIFKSLIRDEFQKKDIYTLAEARAKVQAWPGSDKWWFQNVYLSTPPPAGATMDDIEKAKLPEFYKQWTVINDLVKDPLRGPDVIRRLKAKGCEVWSYRCWYCMQRQSILEYYRLWLWDCYLRGLDGAAQWTSGGRKGSDGFDSRDGYDDGILWEGNDGIMIPTKRFEAFREGLEDIAYMDRLAKELAAAKAKGREYPAYQALLDGRADIVKAMNQQRLDAWRLAAGRAIDQLTRKKK